jgi:uncharacterized membrane protein YdbT with pleckstrin-like domain
MAFLDKELQDDEVVIYTGNHYLLSFIFGMGDSNSYIGSRYYVTNKRLLFKCGWFFPDPESISLRKVEVVRPIQNWYQRLFGIGSIEIIGIGGTQYLFKKISDPQEFYRQYQYAESNT